MRIPSTFLALCGLSCGLVAAQVAAGRNVEAAVGSKPTGQFGTRISRHCGGADDEGNQL